MLHHGGPGSASQRRPAVGLAHQRSQRGKPVGLPTQESRFPVADGCGIGIGRGCNRWHTESPSLDILQL